MTADHASTDVALTLATPAPVVGPAGAGEPLFPPTRPGAQRFGKYEVIGELGEGGMGRVYKAVDTELGRIVAVKVLRSTDPFECSRFRGEAEMIAGLDHPNIVKVFDIATPPEGRPYIVLEYCEGGSLDRELGGNPVEPRRAAEMIETLARAVSHAHTKGVIHRDLKPANVLRAKDKTLKLTDFGLAKEMEVSSGMTPSNAVMGTPSYMSPEQAEGKVKQLGPPTDVYGLGAILYEMITGRPPFRGVNMVDTLEQVRWAEPAPPSRLVPRLHRDLATVCLKCLQKAPARRYQTAGELADDLRRFLNGETIAARRAPSWERLVRQVKRRPWQAATVAAAVLMLTGAVAAGLYVHERNALDERRRLREEARAANEKADADLREAQKKADEDRHATQRRADEERHAAQRRTEDRLSRQAQGSLAALNDIRALVLDGPLRHHPGLDPLYDKLSAYYDRLIKEDDLGFDKVELADGLVKVGDLFVRAGRKTEARAAYRKAADGCRPLATANPRARGVLVDALLKGGQAAIDSNDLAAADTASTDVEGLNPTDPDDLAEAHHLRGQVLAKRNEFLKAEDAFRRSIAIRERLAAPYATDLPPAGDARAKGLAALGEVGRGHGFLGGALLDANKLPEAEAAYWRSHEVRTRVADAFGDQKGGDALNARLQLARSWGNFVGLYARQRSPGAARYFAEKSLAVHDELARLDPINVDNRIDTCARLIQLAELDIQMWVRPKAPLEPARRKAIDDTLEKAKALVAEDPTTNGDPTKDRRTPRERGLHATAQALQGVLLADADAEKAQPLLIASHLMFAKLCKEEPGATTADPLHLYYWALGRAMMTETSTTARTPERIKERIDAVRQAVERGGAKRRHPDDVAQFRAFDSLKDQPEFQKVMATLRAKAEGKPAAGPATVTDPPVKTSGSSP